MINNTRRESSKRNYYIISPRVIIKAIIIIISTRQKLTKISWYKYFGAKFSKRIRQGAQIDGLLPADKIGDSPIK